MAIVPENGKDKVLMFRKLGDKKAAAKLALQTEHKWEFERSSDSKPTKDGAINSDGGLETKLAIEAVSSRDDVNKLLKDSVVDGFKLEVWEIDLAGEPDLSGKLPAVYAIGSLNTWELPSNVEDLATVSAEMAIDGKPQAGFATVSKEQQEEIMYAFKDVTAIED